jgi:N6-L-threonylcarbamoyladenine synthase
MLLLTIESTCDETAAALITGDRQVLSSVIASQDDLHQKFGGVVPEVAARAHVERILPVIDETLRRADKSLSDLTAIAVANTPGLAGSLLVGLVAAKTLCAALDIPLIGVNHLQAHIYACQFSTSENIYPCIGFIVSGGHTNLFRCDDALTFQHLGSTIDDAAGEAFDKVAAMLGLGYPGGPTVSKLAANGNPRAFAFPRSFIHEPNQLKFSFSGLKTAVRYAITGPGNHDVHAVKLSEPMIADLCASFQQAVVDCLVIKAFDALRMTGFRTLCVGGGVAANRAFRQALLERSELEKAVLHIADPKLCTDNAVMGAIALERYQAGLFESLELDVTPGLVRK